MINFFFIPLLLLGTTLSAAASPSANTSLLPRFSQQKSPQRAFRPEDPKKIYVRKNEPEITKSANSTYLGVQQLYSWIDLDSPHDLQGYLISAVAGWQMKWIQGRFCNLYLNFLGEGYWNAGRITSELCFNSHIQEYLAEVQIGIPFFTNNGMMVTPYIGFGYNLYKNNEDPHSAQLIYSYTKLFIPVGIKLCYTINSCWSITPQLELRPDVTAHVSVRSYDDIHVEKKGACRLYLPLSYQFGDPEKCFCNGSLSFALLFDYNSFGKRDEKNCYSSPLFIEGIERSMLGYRLQCTMNF